MDPIADSILALIAAHGKDAVTAAAVRTLPVIPFAESNEAIGKYKDDVYNERKQLSKAKDELVVLNRLITNLEGEVRRQAKELVLNEVQAVHGTRNLGATLKDREKASAHESLIDRIASCPGAYITNSNPHKILVEDPEGDLLAEAISLSGDMVLATIHCEGGSSSQVYMPLHHFLELYNKI